MREIKTGKYLDKHWDLRKVIEGTRDEPVVSIEELSKIIKREFDDSEKKLLIKLLED